MKTPILIILTGVILFASYLTIRFTNIFNWYSVATSSNEPTYHAGHIIFGSRLVKPAFQKHLIFKAPDKDTYIFRCIGMPGDVIEIKAGMVYRNNKKLTEPYTTNEYQLNQQQAGVVQRDVYSDHQLQAVNDSVFNAMLSDQDLKKFHLIGLKPFAVVKGYVNDNIYPPFKQKGFNEDNLGPVTVPAHSYFLMGDNRHNAYDSRYLGFINEDKVLATVIN